MKKRIWIFTLVFALLCGMSASAAAASVSKTGVTPIGDLGSYRTEANLGVYSEHAVATTWSGAENYEILRTTVRYTYMSNIGHEKTLTVSGYSTATAYPTDMKDALSAISGNSQHSVLGGSDYGDWFCSLSANVW